MIVTIPSNLCLPVGNTATVNVAVTVSESTVSTDFYLIQNFLYQKGIQAIAIDTPVNVGMNWQANLTVRPNNVGYSVTSNTASVMNGSAGLELLATAANIRESIAKIITVQLPFEIATKDPASPWPNRFDDEIEFYHTDWPIFKFKNLLSIVKFVGINSYFKNFYGGSLDADQTYIFRYEGISKNSIETAGRTPLNNTDIDTIFEVIFYRDTPNKVKFSADIVKFAGAQGTTYTEILDYTNAGIYPLNSSWYPASYRELVMGRSIEIDSQYLVQIPAGAFTGSSGNLSLMSNTEFYDLCQKVYYPKFYISSILEQDGIAANVAGNIVTIEVKDAPPYQVVRMYKSASTNDFFGVGYPAGVVMSVQVPFDGLGQGSDTSYEYPIAGVGSFNIVWPTNPDYIVAADPIYPISQPQNTRNLQLTISDSAVATQGNWSINPEPGGSAFYQESNISVVPEGRYFDLKLLAQGIGTSLNMLVPYSISSNTSDIVGAALSGNLILETIESGYFAGSSRFLAVDDLVAEGQETITVAVTGGPLAGNTANLSFKIQDFTLIASITPQQNSGIPPFIIDEVNVPSIIFDYSIANRMGRSVYWRASGISGNVTNSDFVVNSGNITSDTGSFTVTVDFDNLVETPETFTIELYESSVYAGTPFYTWPNTVTINETFVWPKSALEFGYIADSDGFGFRFTDATVANVTSIIVTARVDDSSVGMLYDMASPTTEIVVWNNNFYDLNDPDTFQFQLPAINEFKRITDYPADVNTYNYPDANLYYRITVNHSIYGSWTSNSSSKPSDYVINAGFVSGTIPGL